MKTEDGNVLNTIHNNVTVIMVQIENRTKRNLAIRNASYL